MTPKIASNAILAMASVIVIAASPARALTLYGTLDLELALTLSPEIPDGTPISASLSARAGDTMFVNQNTLFVTAVANKGKATFVVPVAYGWRVTSVSASDLIEISANVSASFTKGGKTYSFQSDFFDERGLPANGAKTPVKIVGSL
jgi:hypothetical protein